MVAIAPDALAQLLQDPPDYSQEMALVEAKQDRTKDEEEIPAPIICDTEQGRGVL